MKRRTVALSESDWETLTLHLTYYADAQQTRVAELRHDARRFGAEAFLDLAERASELEGRANEVRHLIEQIDAQVCNLNST